MLAVTPLQLDFGTDRTNLQVTVSNTGSGVLNFSILAPQEGWITLSQTQGPLLPSQ